MTWRANTAKLLERQRIRLLLERDGRAAARAWVERTRRLYAEAVADPRSYASQPQHRPSFEASIHTFDTWLAHPEQVESMPDNLKTPT